MQRITKRGIKVETELAKYRDTNTSKARLEEGGTGSPLGKRPMSRVEARAAGALPETGAGRSVAPPQKVTEDWVGAGGLVYTASVGYRRLPRKRD